MLDGEHLAGSAETRLYFVANEKDAVAVEHLLDLAEIVGWRYDDAALAHHWFGDERSNVTCSREANDFFQSLAPEVDAAPGLIGPRRAINIRSGSEGYARSIGTAALLTSLIACDGEGAPGATV